MENCRKTMKSKLSRNPITVNLGDEQGVATRNNIPVTSPEDETQTVIKTKRIKIVGRGNVDVDRENNGNVDETVFNNDENVELNPQVRHRKKIRKITDGIPFYKGCFSYIILLVLIIPYSITVFTDMLYQPFKLVGTRIPSKEHTIYYMQYSDDFPAIPLRIATLIGYSLIIELIQIAMIGFVIAEKVVLKKFGRTRQSIRPVKVLEVHDMDLLFLFFVQLGFLTMFFSYTTSYIRDYKTGLIKLAVGMLTFDLRILFIIYFILFLLKMKYVRLYFPPVEECNMQ